MSVLVLVLVVGFEVCVFILGGSWEFFLGDGRWGICPLGP